MTRDEFMKKARGTVDQAFEHRKKRYHESGRAGVGGRQAQCRS